MNGRTTKQDRQLAKDRPAGDAPPDGAEGDAVHQQVNEPPANAAPPGLLEGGVPDPSFAALLRLIGEAVRSDPRFGILWAIAAGLSLITIFVTSDNVVNLFIGVGIVFAVALILLMGMWLADILKHRRPPADVALELWRTMLRATQVLIWFVVFAIITCSALAISSFAINTWRPASGTPDKPDIPRASEEKLPEPITASPPPTPATMLPAPPPPSALFEGLNEQLTVAAGQVHRVNAKRLELAKLELQAGAQLVLPATGCELIVRDLISVSGDIIAAKDTSVPARDDYRISMKVHDARQVRRLRIIADGAEGAGFEPGKRAAKGADGKSAGGEKLFNPTGHSSGPGARGSSGAPGQRGQDALDVYLWLGMPPETAEIRISANGGDGGRGQDGGVGGTGGNGSNFHSASSGGAGGAGGRGGDGGAAGEVKVMVMFPKELAHLQASWSGNIVVTNNPGSAGEGGTPGPGGSNGRRGGTIKINEGSGDSGPQGAAAPSASPGRAADGNVEIISYEKFYEEERIDRRMSSRRGVPPALDAICVVPAEDNV